MEFRAEARFMRISPQKARLVLDLIKGRRVEDALATLAFTRKRAAPLIEKLVRSALENANYLNAEKNLDVDIDRLIVRDAIANEGPRMKRIRPAPMGRAFRYQRRMAHLSVVLAEKGAKNGAAKATDEETATQAAAPAPAAKRTAGKPKKAAAKKSTGRKSAGKK